MPGQSPAHVYEPSLPWPSTKGRCAPSRAKKSEVAVSTGWSSQNVARAEEPLARVAALLLSISQNNGYEGRDPQTLPDALTSGFVADLLGVDIATLAALLVDLNRRGLIEGAPNSALRLKDVAGLEKLAH